MKIDVIAVGRLKEKYLRDACTEYEKRLSRYCRLTVTEVADEKTPEQAGDAVNEKIKELEAQRVLKHLKEDAFIITLEIKGEEMDSEELAERMDRLTVSGVSHFQFVIGGSLGLSPLVTEKSRLHLSFSRLTFPHQLMRVMLLEQLYRGYRIRNGEPYHK